MSRKRERLEIIQSILHAVQEKGNRARPTHILYKSNLSHQMLTEYLGELLKGGFMIEAQDRKGNKEYSLTDKGHNYIKDYQSIKSFIDSYGLG